MSMEIKEFAEKVIALRTAQKNYFKHRQPVDLILSKQLEKEVDNLAAEIAYGKEDELPL
jgi:hypothetical protein